MTALISAAALEKILHQPDVRILDASYGLPPFAQGIPGAIDFDIDAVANLSAPLPHTIPSAETFEKAVGGMGISNNTTVIVYDRAGMAMAASRVWWMFRLFGHDNVSVLDGGLPAWLKAGYPLSDKNTHPEPAAFNALYRPHLFRDKQQMVDNLGNPAFRVLDARDRARFTGEAKEPRPGISSGHIPGAFSVPFVTLLNADGTLKQGDALRAAMGDNITENITCSCGSGVTACVIALALHTLGHENTAIYGGSWTEWGGDASLPKKTGHEP
jgi:thiosulfate/3-mercaptopyruvate sulfurtransferase